MKDSLVIRSLIDEMETLEDRLEWVKRELASRLGLAESPSVQRPDAPSSQQTEAPEKPADKPPAKRNPARVGTKGRTVLEAIFDLGGQAKAPTIAEMISGLGEDRAKKVKRVRTYFFHLSDTGFLEKTDERGLWKISEMGYIALGKTQDGVAVK